MKTLAEILKKRIREMGFEDLKECLITEEVVSQNKPPHLLFEKKVESA